MTKSHPHPTAVKAMRRDARENRERLVAAALTAIARDGFHVPVSRIAAQAGVGVGTFYRSFVDRDALMRELQLRAYDQLIAILDRLEARGETGLTAIGSFLRMSLSIADQLILPLHGASPLLDGVAVAKRQEIDAKLENFLAQGRAAGAIGDDVNATDVIICSALITQPAEFGPDWIRRATRHIGLFLSGLASPGEVREAAVSQAEVESALRAQSRQTEGSTLVTKSRTS